MLYRRDIPGWSRRVASLRSLGLLVRILGSPRFAIVQCPAERVLLGGVSESLCSFLILVFKMVSLVKIY